MFVPRTLIPIAFLSTLIAGCGAAISPAELGEEADAVTGGAGRAFAARDADFYCPAGTTLVSGPHVCASSTEVVGPFPKAMIAACKRAGGGSACDGARWARGFALDLRGGGQCPAGTTLDAATGYCADGNDIFGPFLKTHVERCKQTSSPAVCETMRWDRRVVPRGATPPPDPNGPVASAFNQKLVDYYAQRANYDRVYDDVMGWFGTTKNACVAFMSTAMRQVGLAVPKGDTSLVTLDLSRWLEGRGWTRSRSADALRPGDVVFSEDDPSWPGYPAHVFLFHSWVDRAAGIGKVVDNQGFLIDRNIVGYGCCGKTPMAYFLRAPN